MEINKKELIAEYKARPEKGGVFSITNKETGKALIEEVLDLQGSKNRFDFSVKTGGCVHMKLQEDWKKYSPTNIESCYKFLLELKCHGNQI